MAQVISFGILSTFFFTVAALGQLSTPIKCGEIEQHIADSIKISKVSRRVTQDDECRFYFYSGSEWVSVNTERYKTHKESRRAFSDEFDFLTLAESYPESVRPISRSKIWSEAKTYSSPFGNDYLIMLRHKKVNIKLMSSSYGLISRIESTLRAVSFSF